MSTYPWPAPPMRLDLPALGWTDCAVDGRGRPVDPWPGDVLGPDDDTEED